MKSIKWKLVFMYITLVFIVLILSGIFTVYSLQEREKNAAREELMDYADIIIKDIIEPYAAKGKSAEPLTLNTFSKSLFQLMNNNSITLQAHIIRYSKNSPNCLTLASTVTMKPEEFLQFQNSAVIAATQKEMLFEYRPANKRAGEDYSETVKSWYEYAVPYVIPNDANETILITYVRKDASNAEMYLNDVIRIIIISIVAALLITGFLGVLFSSTLTDPIASLTRRAKELAEGNLTIGRYGKISPNEGIFYKDEIGQLNESFDYMAEKLSVTMSDMEGEKSKLEIILNNMSDGILAFDGKGKNIHANYISCDLLGISDLEDISLEEVLKILHMEMCGGLENQPPEQWLKSIMPLESTPNEGGICIGDKYINASFNVYKSKDDVIDGVVIVLSDITKHTKLDNMRKEFVANVSHELRTPLTTIKGYAETLMHGGVEDQNAQIDFLRIIDSEADRMAVILKDLLELSRYDNKKYQLNLDETNLVDLIKQVVKQNIVTAEKHEKSIVFEPPQEEMLIEIDAQRINQVLNNIITNSLKYSNPGTVICILLEETESSCYLYVKDNGIGIPREDIRRIFERFYRVDKARSREMGGTGLGLSIAKEIMEAHGGKITCSSEVNKGTTMILRFPKGFGILGDNDMID